MFEQVAADRPSLNLARFENHHNKFCLHLTRWPVRLFWNGPLTKLTFDVLSNYFWPKRFNILCSKKCPTQCWSERSPRTPIDCAPMPSSGTPCGSSSSANGLSASTSSRNVTGTASLCNSRRSEASFGSTFRRVCRQPGAFRRLPAAATATATTMTTASKSPSRKFKALVTLTV